MTALPERWRAAVDEWNEGKESCPPKPRWKVWRGRHRWTEDGAPSLNTMTYSYALICRDCGRVAVAFAAY